MVKRDRVRHYQVVIAESKMEQLRLITGCQFNKDALTAAVEFTNNNFVKEELKQEPESEIEHVEDQC